MTKTNTKNDDTTAGDPIDNDALVEQWLAEDDDPEVETLDTELGPVKVRALSRDEVHRMVNSKGGLKGQEARALATAVLSPKMTAEQWGKAMKRRKSGTISDVVDAIMALSGMEEGATKAARAIFRDDTE